MKNENLVYKQMRKCVICGKVTTPGGMRMHQENSNHDGWILYQEHISDVEELQKSNTILARDLQNCERMLKKLIAESKDMRSKSEEKQAEFSNLMDELEIDNKELAEELEVQRTNADRYSKLAEEYQELIEKLMKKLDTRGYIIAGLLTVVIYLVLLISGVIG